MCICFFLIIHARVTPFFINDLEQEKRQLFFYEMFFVYKNREFFFYYIKMIFREIKSGAKGNISANRETLDP